MAIIRRMAERVIFIMTVIAIVMMTSGCSNAPLSLSSTNPTPQSIYETIDTGKIESETIITEKTETETIERETTIPELKEVEKVISQQWDNNNSSIKLDSCQTYYLSQEKIENLNEIEGLSHLCNEEININQLLHEIADDAGIIITVVILQKAGFPVPVRETVIASVDQEIIKSLAEGAISGAAEGIDPSGKLSAILHFSKATIGFISSIDSLVENVSSIDTSSIASKKGLSYVLATVNESKGVYNDINEVLSSAQKTFESAKNAVNLIQSSGRIEWDKVDWNKVKDTAYQNAINSAAAAIENGADTIKDEALNTIKNEAKSFIWSLITYDVA